MSEQGYGAASAIEFETDAEVSRSMVGIVRARDVHLTKAAAGLVAADGSFTILNGGCGPVAANGSVTIHNGGCGPVIASGSFSVENGGAQTVIAGGGAKIGPNAIVGLVASPSVTVEEGGRVIIGSPLALAVGAAAGAVLTMLACRRRRAQAS